jgi:hypothetical protein
MWDVLHCQLVAVIEVSKESCGFICSVRREMKAICSTEMSVPISKSTCCNIPEDLNLKQH